MPDQQGQSLRTAVVVFLVCLLAAFSLLPIANWIPDGHAAPWYGVTSDVWLGGTLLAAGIGIVLAMVSRRVPRIWRPGLFDGVVRRWAAAPRAPLAIALVAFVLYCAVALLVFDGRPLMVDEFSQLLHAQAFTDGRLGRPNPAHPEFFSSIQFLDVGTQTVSHFPPGGPAVLAIGLLLGASWIAVPLCGAVAVLAFSSIVRRIEPRHGVALGATLLFAFSPFVVFMTGTHLNHVPMLAAALVGAAAMLRVTGSSQPLAWTAFASGLGFGVAATIRPADALAFAAPAAIWYLALALRDRRRWIDALAAAAGVAIPIGAMLWVNAQTTGSPLLFAYEVLWGPEVSLGFHASAPWGEPHTPLRGVELVNIYLLRLGVHLFESPIPGVLPALAALAMTRRMAAGDRYLLATVAVLMATYFAYWFNGQYLGPRFLIPVAPIVALWTARFFPLLRERLGDSLHYRSAVFTAATAGVIALCVAIPARAREYAEASPRPRWDVARFAREANISNALILVRESWSTQLLTRLSALDIPLPDARRFRSFVDQCVLEEKLAELERVGAHGPAALAALRPLMRDSAIVTGIVSYGVRSGARLPGLEYSETCRSRIAEERAGTADLNPMLLVRDAGNVYARDLHARDTLLLEEMPERPVYLVRQENGMSAARPVFIPLSRDSLWMAWTGHPAPAPVTAARH